MSLSSGAAIELELCMFPALIQIVFLIASQNSAQNLFSGSLVHDSAEIGEVKVRLNPSLLLHVKQTNLRAKKSPIEVKFKDPVSRKWTTPDVSYEIHFGSELKVSVVFKDSFGRAIQLTIYQNYSSSRGKHFVLAHYLADQPPRETNLVVTPYSSYPYALVSHPHWKDVEPLEIYSGELWRDNKHLGYMRVRLNRGIPLKRQVLVHTSSESPFIIEFKQALKEPWRRWSTTTKWMKKNILYRISKNPLRITLQFKFPSNWPDFSGELRLEVPNTQPRSGSAELYAIDNKSNIVGGNLIRIPKSADLENITLHPSWADLFGQDCMSVLSEPIKRR